MTIQDLNEEELSNQDLWQMKEKVDQHLLGRVVLPPFQEFIEGRVAVYQECLADNKEFPTDPVRDEGTNLTDDDEAILYFLTSSFTGPKQRFLLLWKLEEDHSRNLIFLALVDAIGHHLWIAQETYIWIISALSIRFILVGFTEFQTILRV